MSETEKTLADLDSAERLALVALLKRIALANQEVSDDEADNLTEIAQSMGYDEYQRLMNVADSRFENDEALREYLKNIFDQSARELIYGLVMMEAGIDGIQPSEAEVLTWLATDWGISMVSEGMDFSA